jgi:hypothetical protein
VSLHRVDPRFVVPHRVRRARVLGGLEEWRSGLVSAGVEVTDDQGVPDLVVCPARLTDVACGLGAGSIIVEGSRESALREGGYAPRRLLLRPARERPTLALPLDQRTPASYALERWSVVDRRWKSVRMRAARALVSRGAFPAWASPIVTVGSRAAGQPTLVAAAHELGVPNDVGWFLTFGQGDALSRNAFQLFRAGAEGPDWVLKFARVAGYAKRFDDDEQGLRLAHGAGGVVAARVPRMVGRFEVDGIHASVETAAAGRRLRDVLRMPGDRAPKLRTIERIADWILELGRLTTSPPAATAPERERIRADLVDGGGELGLLPELVDEVPPLPAVVQHNDLGTWNVVADDGEFTIVDWENARAAALPLWDLLYFLGDAFVLLDGSDDPADLPGRIAGLFAGDAPSSPALFSLVRRAVEHAAIPADAVGAIATLCWLSHSLSIRAHNVDIDALTPQEGPRAHGLEGIVRAWMSHPGLGPGWSVWRT